MTGKIPGMTIHQVTFLSQELLRLMTVMRAPPRNCEEFIPQEGSNQGSLDHTTNSQEAFQIPQENNPKGHRRTEPKGCPWDQTRPHFLILWGLKDAKTSAVEIGDWGPRAKPWVGGLVGIHWVLKALQEVCFVLLFHSCTLQISYRISPGPKIQRIFRSRSLPRDPCLESFFFLGKVCGLYCIFIFAKHQLYKTRVVQCDPIAGPRWSCGFDWFASETCGSSHSTRCEPGRGGVYRPTF